MKCNIMKKLLFICLLLASLSMTSFATEAKAANATLKKMTFTMNGLNYSLPTYHINGQVYVSLDRLTPVFANAKNYYTFDFSGNKLTLYPKTRLVELIYSMPDSKTNPYAAPKVFHVKVTGKKGTTKINGYMIEDMEYVKLSDMRKLLNTRYEQKGNHTIVFKNELPANTIFLEKSTKEENLKTASHPRWAEPIKDFIYKNDDGSITTVEGYDNIKITTYNSQFKKIKTKNLTKELPIFGTFYSGKKYNYISYGQNNLKEKNIEVVRIVKYDKNFKRLGAVSIKGYAEEITKPFDASSGGRMAELGDVLIYHTSKEIFKIDNVNHQTNAIFFVNTKTMKQVESDAYNAPYVSHSFDQYVLADENGPAYLSHGDSYPRSIHLAFKTTIEDPYEFNEDELYKNQSLDLYQIYGQNGANVTGVSIGGFEASKSHYIVAFNAIKQKKSYKYGTYELTGGNVNRRNVYVYSTPKNVTSSQKIMKTTLARYDNTQKYTSTPTLVKIDHTHFVAMWEEFKSNKTSNGLKYVLLDEKGKKISKVYKNQYLRLSNVQPTIKNKKIIWYSHTHNAKILYKLDYQPLLK